jgi:hypothetical protein
MVQDDGPPNGFFWTFFVFCALVALAFMGTLIWAIVKVVSRFTG